MSAPWGPWVLVSAPWGPGPDKCIFICLYVQDAGRHPRPSPGEIQPEAFPGCKGTLKGFLDLDFWIMISGVGFLDSDSWISEFLDFMFMDFQLEAAFLSGWGLLFSFSDQM